MDPNETLRRWRDARDRGDVRSASEYRGYLFQWLRRGGFEPRWQGNERAVFMRRSSTGRRNPARRAKGKTMARRTAAQKAAFRKMKAGLARYRKRLGRGKRRRGTRRAAVRARRLRARTVTVIAVRKPRRKRSRRRVAARRRTNLKGAHMARRKRRRRSRATAILVNPRRRHHRRSRLRHRRRNPSGFVGMTFGAAIPAVLTAGGLAFADAKLLANQIPAVRIGVKVAIGAVLAFFLRRKPDVARLVIASTFASIAYEGVTKLAGGVSAPNQVAAAAQLKQLVLEDPVAGRAAMGVLVEGPPRMAGMGARLDNTVNLSGPIEQSANVLPPGGHFQQVSLG